MPEVNPYESPKTAGASVDKLDRGVGVWRDGNLVVIHKSAELPSICIETGVPTKLVRIFKLKWSNPIDLLARSHALDLPLTEAVNQKLERQHRISWLIFAGPILVGVALLFVVREWPEWLQLVVAGAIAVGTWTCHLLQNSLQKRIIFVRVRDEYFWIRGFDPRFVAQLPEWESV